MGKFGYHVIDADGHGGEAADWRERVPAKFKQTMAAYRDRIAKHYGRLTLPGGGTARKGDKFDIRPGMNDPVERLEGHGPRGHRHHHQLPRRRRRGVGDARSRLRRRAVPDDQRRQGGVLPSRPGPHQGASPSCR